MRVVEQHEIGEHLDRAVRDVAGDERVLETSVLEAQHEATVLGGLGLDAAYARHAFAHHSQDAVEAVAMVLVEVLRDLGDVVAARRKMLGVAGLGTRPGIADVEVGDVPVLDQAAELGDDPELLELPKPLDGEHAGIVEHMILALLDHALLLRRLPRW